jgi:hypothetical protein
MMEGIVQEPFLAETGSGVEKQDEEYYREIMEHSRTDSFVDLKISALEIEMSSH